MFKRVIFKCLPTISPSSSSSGDKMSTRKKALTDRSTSSWDIKSNKSDKITETCTTVVEKEKNVPHEQLIKTKSELRAERRILQESQRAAKLLKKEDKKIVKTEIINSTTIIKKVNRVLLFAHLNSTKHNSTVDIHPAVIKLGSQYLNHTVIGSNARCLNFLKTVKEIIVDYQLDGRTFEAIFEKQIQYLGQCRPLSVSMLHAIKFLKLQFLQMSIDASVADETIKLIDNYIYENIDISGKAISLNLQQLIKHNDVILTYACSSVIERILKDRHSQGVRFKVIIVDASPFLEGRQLLQRLVNFGIKCSYVLINSVCFAMIECTKVLLGAHALLANGFVMSRVGTAQIALAASSRNVPVLVCCETYKFSDRVQMDAFVFNEIGRAFPLKCTDLNGDFDVTPLNLMYDVTPPDLVTAVVTDLAILPCSSVPVVLRVKPT